mmetsp:Transcript_9965/g.23622  ORF Transcript_9965/g.23622 Transcript_9965/m.23622 type:complete len:209 (+) Transcript_9965:99-725(+)
MIFRDLSLQALHMSSSPRKILVALAKAYLRRSPSLAYAHIPRGLRPCCSCRSHSTYSPPPQCQPPGPGLLAPRQLGLESSSSETSRCPREMPATRATPQAAAQFRGTATNQNHTKRLHHSRRTQELRQFRWSTTSRSDTGTNTSPRRRAHLGDEIACRDRGIARPSWYNSTARSSVRSKPPTTAGPPECPCSTQRRWSPYRTRSSVRP